MASGLAWTQYTEAVVGRNHPVLADTDNRALRQLLTASGLNPDAASFNGIVTNVAVALTSGVAPALDASLGTYFTLNITSNIAVVIAVPLNAPAAGFSQFITIAVRNSSGGALTTTPTFNTGAGGFKFNTVTAVPNGKQVLYQFCWDAIQGFWYQVGSPGPAL